VSTLAAQGLALRAGGAGRTLCLNLSVDVQAGQCWVVLGPNGAGKSTLLATLAGLLAPSAGRVSLNERALAQWPLQALAAERAWCPAHWSDPFPATVAETVRLARQLASPDHELLALLADWDVAHLAHADVRTLSGGERQRVALAAACWQAAPLLLLDEPASHLDLSHQQLLVRRLQAHTQGGGSAVVTLHDLNLAWSVATHAVLLDGRGGAHAGARETVLTPEHLSAAFGVPVAWVEVCGHRRFWVDEPATA
jgi:iron complex transport system ATP-binding protein